MAQAPLAAADTAAAAESGASARAAPQVGQHRLSRQAPRLERSVQRGGGAVVAAHVQPAAQAHGAERVGGRRLRPGGSSNGGRRGGSGAGSARRRGGCSRSTAKRQPRARRQAPAPGWAAQTGCGTSSGGASPPPRPRQTRRPAPPSPPPPAPHRPAGPGCPRWTPTPGPAGDDGWGGVVQRGEGDAVMGGRGRVVKNNGEPGPHTWRRGPGGRRRRGLAEGWEGGWGGEPEPRVEWPAAGGEPTARARGGHGQRRQGLWG